MAIRNPSTIDERTWFYSDKKALEVVHEFYKNGEFKRIMRFSIPQSLIQALSSQADNTEELEELIKYLPSIVRMEVEEARKEQLTS